MSYNFHFSRGQRPVWEKKRRRKDKHETDDDFPRIGNIGESRRGRGGGSKGELICFLHCSICDFLSIAERENDRGED